MKQEQIVVVNRKSAEKFQVEGKLTQVYNQLRVWNDLQKQFKILNLFKTNDFLTEVKNLGGFVTDIHISLSTKDFDLMIVAISDKVVETMFTVKNSEIFKVYGDMVIEELFRIGGKLRSKYNVPDDREEYLRTYVDLNPQQINQLANYIKEWMTIESYPYICMYTAERTGWDLATPLQTPKGNVYELRSALIQILTSKGNVYELRSALIQILDNAM